MNGNKQYKCFCGSVNDNMIYYNIVDTKYEYIFYRTQDFDNNHHNSTQRTIKIFIIKV